MSTTHLVPKALLRDHIVRWLQEDVPAFDIGGAVVGEAETRADLFQKQSGVVAGTNFFEAVFTEVNCRVEWLVTEGTETRLAPGERCTIARVHGRACDVLLGERTALNLMARASGIATRARALADLKAQRQWTGIVAGTRKTTPGFRLLEKQAMLTGGCDTHRMDLSSMVMLKDNHIWSKGSITEAVSSARALAGFSTKIEVECSKEVDAREAIAAGADIVMLDNMSPQELGDMAARLKADFPNVLLEGSGGLTDATIADYMVSGVDILSTSWIHQGVPHIDFSLKISH